MFFFFETLVISQLSIQSPRISISHELSLYHIQQFHNVNIKWPWQSQLNIPCSGCFFIHISINQKPVLLPELSRELLAPAPRGQPRAEDGVYRHRCGAARRSGARLQAARELGGRGRWPEKGVVVGGWEMDGKWMGVFNFRSSCLSNVSNTRCLWNKRYQL